MSDSEVRLVTSCLGTSTAQVDTAPAEATDPHYSDPNSSVGVSDTVDVFPSAAAAQFDVSMAANPKLPACFEKLAPRFESGAPKGVHFGRLSAHRGAVPALGDKDASLSASVPFTYQGSSGTLYVEVVMIEKGRSESNLLFVGENSAPDQALVDQVASAAAATLTSS